MIDNNNIEKLIKHKLEHLETEVSVNVWDRIEKNLDQLQPTIDSPSGSESIVSSGGANIASWVAGISAAVIGVSTIAFFMLSEPNQQVTDLGNKEIVESVEQSTAIVSEEENENTVGQEANADIELNKQSALSENNVVVPEKVILVTENNQSDISDNKVNTVSDDNYANDFSGENNSETYDAGNDEFNNVSNLSDVNSSSTTSNEPVVSGSIDESLTEQTAEPINENFDTEINTAHIEEAVGEQEHLNTRPSSLGPVPTIITPNGDGINDHFIFPTENIAEIQINIYDSRGSLLLNHKGDANWHWDGTLKNGQPAPNGNYYFAVYARGYDNKMHQEKGSLYINR